MKNKKILLLIILLFAVCLKKVNANTNLDFRVKFLTNYTVLNNEEVNANNNLVMSINVASSFAGGTGSSTNPYQISNANELALLAFYINNSSTNGSYASKYYVLTDDIDLSEYDNWVPIGFGNGIYFKGNFNGQGHIIKNMKITIDSLDENYKLSYGLFGTVNNNGLITNIELIDSQIDLNLPSHEVSTKDLDIGMFIGHIDNNASVINCIVKNSSIHVHNTFELGNAIALKIGGIIGDAGDASSATRNIKMENLYSNVNITIDDSEWTSNSNTNRYYQLAIGGIVGRLRRVHYFPKNCIYTGEITSKYAFIAPIYASYRYTEGSTFNEYSKMYIAYSASTSSNTIEFDTDSNFFYNYIVNGTEIGSDYQTELYSRNISDSAGNTITIYTLGDNLPYSNEFYMKNFQGINRGDFAGSLSSKLAMFNAYAATETQYNCVNWFYNSYTDSYSFTQDENSIELVDLGNYSYEARLISSSEFTYKWYINDVLQDESSNIITIDMPLSELYLKVEVYENLELIGSVERLVEEFKLEVSLVKEDGEEGLEIFRINYDNVLDDNPIIENYSFVWYEIVKNEETSEYETNLLPCTDDNWITSNSSYGYKVLLINKNSNKYNKELIYINDESIKYVFVSYENYEYENGMYYSMGNDNNTGDSPEHAVKTIKRAYELLDSNKDMNNQFIIIIGRCNEVYKSVKYNINKNDAIFTKPAFITGSFLGTEYYGNLYINVDNFINAPTSFDNIKISSSTTADYFFYAQGNDLYLGENISMNIIGNSSAILTGTKAPAFNIVAGFLDYSTNNHINSEICHIVVKSGFYARILGGNRNTGDYVKYNNYGLTFTPDNPLNVVIDIDINNDSTPNPNNYDYDVNLLVGGQTDGSSYANVKINILNGNIGRVIGGSQGFGHTTSNNYPVDSFFGSVTTNIMGGNIGQLYSGSLGRNTPTSYFYGKMVTNISGGIIHENIFGSGAGGVSGFSDDSSLYDETFEVVKSLVTNVTMTDMDGNTYRLDKATSTINISGGVIEGSVYGGGYGYSSMLPEAENIALDGGSLYGDVSLNISGGVIQGSVYGGGKGTDLYGEDRTELANVYGNVSVNITGNPTINGNIYAGSEGLHNYPDMAKIIGNVNLTINGEEVTFNGNIYGGSNAGLVDGSSTLNVSNLSTSGKIFGGGNAGNVLGNITATIDNVNALELYGGGDSGNISGSVNLNISNSIFEDNIYGGCKTGDVYQTVSLNISETEASEIYGGGLSGNISEYVTSFETGEESGEESHVTSSVIVSSGTYENIFGGGNLGKVFGDTYVKVGTTNTYTEVSGVVYGGGRGRNSDFETVSGASNVLITGKDTRINNYGSIKLGKVVGNVYLIFKDYYVNNPTNRYKVMNGIDRATTVTFDNSYVLLENIVDGELRGIEDIENIILPSGSGLKISADGHITGDFAGGGKLYLDSAVCMTIDGNISGSTTLVLNPKLADSNTSTIIGRIDNPYMIVKGSSEATDEEMAATSLVSAPGEEYTILTQKSDLTNNYTYYYIKDTIEVNDFINQVAINTKDKKFSSIFSETDDITILNNRSFTSAINITMSFLDDGTKGNKYKDIYKTLTLEDGLDNKVTIYSGTKIYMIFNGTYYYYDVVSDINEIDLGLFKSFQGEYFDNEFSIENVSSTYYSESEATGTRLYTYPEDYRFIFDFSKSITLNSDTLYAKINIIDNDELQELNNHQTNMVNFLNRVYDITSVFDSNVVNFTNLSVDTTIKISALPKGSIINPEYLGMRITLFDEDDNIINLPNNTEVIIGDKTYVVKNGIISFKLSDTPLGLSAINKHIQFSLDVSNVLPQDRLENGNYKLRFGYGLFKNDIMEDIIKQEDILDFSVNNFLLNDYIANYGLKASLVSDNNVPKEKRQSDKEKLIDLGSIENRTINIEYTSVIDKGSIVITAMKKDNNSFNYQECEGISFSTDTINLEYTYDMNRNITATFEDTLEKGFYRIYVTLYNEMGEKVTSDYVNFLVYGQ